MFGEKKFGEEFGVDKKFENEKKLESASNAIDGTIESIFNKFNENV